MEEDFKLTISTSENGVKMATYVDNGIVTRIWQRENESYEEFTQRAIDTLLK